MSDRQTISINLASPFTILAVVFAVAKIMGKIDWSWWLVLAPIWLPMVIVFGIFAIIFIFAILAALID